MTEGNDDHQSNDDHLSNGLPSAPSPPPAAQEYVPPPARAPDQTDRVNKHLLNSFLTRINTGQVPMLNRGDENGAVADRDQWED